MNILFLTKEYNHPKLPATGGAGTFIQIIAKELVKNGHQVTIFIPLKKLIKINDDGVVINSFLKFSKKKPIQNLCASISRKVLSSENSDRFILREHKFWAKALKKHVKNNKIDIIEAWDYGAFFYYLKNITSIPVVIRCHGSAGVLSNYFGYEDRYNFKNIEKQAFKKYDNIIAVSKYTKKINEEWFQKKNIDVIYNGINTNFFKPDNTIPIIKKSIFYFGTISEKKGLKELAKIFNKTLLKHPEATLHLIGKGQEYFNYLYQEIFSTAAQINVKYYGAMDRLSLPQELLKANVIVFPTHGENFPFAFLEAMSLQKPVIVSGIEVSSEIIDHEHNGFIANVLEDYTCAIDRIFVDANFSEKIAKNARKKIEDNFTIEKMTAQTLNYYKKILN